MADRNGVRQVEAAAALKRRQDAPRSRPGVGKYANSAPSLRDLMPNFGNGHPSETFLPTGAGMDRTMFETPYGYFMQPVTDPGPQMPDPTETWYGKPLVPPGQPITPAPYSPPEPAAIAQLIQQAMPPAAQPPMTTPLQPQMPARPMPQQAPAPSSPIAYSPTFDAIQSFRQQATNGTLPREPAPPTSYAANSYTYGAPALRADKAAALEGYTPPPSNTYGGQFRPASDGGDLANRMRQPAGAQAAPAPTPSAPPPSQMDALIQVLVNRGMTPEAAATAVAQGYSGGGESGGGGFRGSFSRPGGSAPKPSSEQVAARQKASDEERQAQNQAQGRKQQFDLKRQYMAQGHAPGEADYLAQDKIPQSVEGRRGRAYEPTRPGMASNPQAAPAPQGVAGGPSLWNQVGGGVAGGFDFMRMAMTHGIQAALAQQQLMQQAAHQQGETARLAKQGEMSNAVDQRNAASTEAKTNADIAHQEWSRSPAGQARTDVALQSPDARVNWLSTKEASGQPLTQDESQELAVHRFTQNEQAVKNADEILTAAGHAGGMFGGSTATQAYQHLIASKVPPNVAREAVRRRFKVDVGQAGAVAQPPQTQSIYSPFNRSPDVLTSNVGP